MTPERTDVALILGGASCVWDDVRALEEIYGRPWDGIVVAANDVGAVWPRDLHHWVSLHPVKFERWMNVRSEQGLDCAEIVLWSQSFRARHHANGLADRTLAPWPGGGSGMAALQVAVEPLGCRRAVLCGIPITMTPHLDEAIEKFAPVWHSASGHWRAWERERERLVGVARSMSGRTRELLSAPKARWLG